MATKTLLGLGLVVSLGLAACGDGEEADAKRAALTPATVAVVDSASIAAAAPVPVDSAVGADSAARADAAADSATEEEETLGRESFSYGGGSRDPFVSLLSTSRVGPELPDLILVAIYYDTRSPSSSVVVLREKVGSRKYNLRPGDRLGRMRLTSVRPKDVTFSIDDFGTERQETVSLRKQEEDN